jgi:uncharacterized protein
MKVVVFGTGYVGGAIVNEMVARGHEVTAVSRSGSSDFAGAAIATGGVQDPDFLAQVTSGSDAIVSALPSRTKDGEVFADNIAALVGASSATGARLGVVGGGSLLPVHPGEPPQGDLPDAPAFLAPLHRAHREALAVLEASDADVDWFELIPAGDFGPHNPLPRRGEYRKGTTTQVLDAEGRSRIGAEDYAIAFADELETPTTHRGWFTVAY